MSHIILREQLGNNMVLKVGQQFIAPQDIGLRVQVVNVLVCDFLLKHFKVLHRNVTKRDSYLIGIEILEDADDLVVRTVLVVLVEGLGHREGLHFWVCAEGLHHVFAARSDHDAMHSNEGD